MFVRAGVVTTTRSQPLGPESRPVAVPDDVADPSHEKASGTVELPLHVRWSGRAKGYDLSKRADLAGFTSRFSERAPTTTVRRFIDVDQLLDLWEELVLPPSVRRAWAAWFRQRRGLEPWC